MRKIIVDFKSLPGFFKKEKSGRKNNIVSKLDFKEIRFLMLRDNMETPSNVCVRITNAVSGEKFIRTVKDISFWDGMTIVTWR